MKTTNSSEQRLSKAEILREYGPYEGIDHVHGVTYDGKQIWFARGESLVAVNPETGTIEQELKVPGDAGSAFDGKHLWQLADDRIHKIDPQSGKVLASIPAPSQGDSGMTWAEGYLWVGEYRARKIRQVDPKTGAVLRTIDSDRFVTGVTWVDGEFWHGTWEGEESDLRRIDPKDGTVLEKIRMPAGVGVSGLESDGADRFFCGGGGTGKLRVVRRPGRGGSGR